MANIPLRAYVREIEGLIDSGQLEETVAHCRHTLQSFPKYIDVYRLLGKVFLEARQFSNAGDILQRVLSAVPDDFVSHVGMSIIREDEGNLDAAIWHMERAFEDQPANNAIQEELRRLFGRRDGMEPPKIRLTRGALARMFVKGHLYDQAIAELRGALSEDPQRPDLQTLLAKMNFLSGNRVEAVETSSNVLKKFPYCLIANRILALILPQSDRADDAKTYEERSHALDPYLSRAGSEALTSDDVPDSAVMIETLQWKPGQTIPGLPEQPAWAETLGIKFEESEEELPDWLTEDLEIPAYEGMQVAPFIDGEGEDIKTADIHDSEKLIPEWMQEAGWQPASGEDEDIYQTDELRDVKEEETELERADIPEWLQEIAPEEAIDNEDLLDESVEDEIPTWLDESPPGATDSIITWLDDKDEASESSIAISQEGDEFGGIGSSQVDSVVPTDEESTDEIEIPEWLKDLETESELDLPIDEAPGDDELPEWLEELEESTVDISKPDEVIEELVTDDEIEISEPEKMEDQFKDEIREGELKELDLDDQDAALAWLESLAAKQGASEEELITSPEERRETPPEWISEEELSSEEVISTEPTTEEGLPDWLLEPEPLEEKMDKGEPGEEEGEFPEWLRDMDDQGPEDLVAESPIVAEVSQEIDTEEIDETVSTDGGEIEFSGEFPSEVEAPIVSSAEPEGVIESTEWIPETPGTEETSLVEPSISTPSYEDFDVTTLSEIDEEITTLEISKEEIQVDINKATLSELEKISGIGFVLAQSIVDYRDEHGPFVTIDDLKNVSGIGDVSFESFKNYLVIEELKETPEIELIEEVTIDNEVFEAQKALDRGDLERAVEAYDNLIKRGHHLDEIISNLEQGLSQNLDNIHLWQTLGDAYMRNDQFQQALDAYTKAEKLL